MVTETAIRDRAKEEIAYLRLWAEVNDCTLAVEGEVGFGRPCVGMLHSSPDHGAHYPCWSDREAGPPADVTSAYHKDDCLAILRHDESQEDHARAIHELYIWCRALEDAGYRVEDVPRSGSEYEAALSPIDVLIHGATKPRLVYKLGK